MYRRKDLPTNPADYSNARIIPLNLTDSSEAIFIPGHGVVNYQANAQIGNMIVDREDFKISLIVNPKDPQPIIGRRCDCCAQGEIIPSNNQDEIEGDNIVTSTPISSPKSRSIGDKNDISVIESREYPIINDDIPPPLNLLEPTPRFNQLNGSMDLDVDVLNNVHVSLYEGQAGQSNTSESFNVENDSILKMPFMLHFTKEQLERPPERDLSEMGSIDKWFGDVQSISPSASLFSLLNTNTESTLSALFKKTAQAIKDTEQEVISTNPKPDKRRTRTTTAEETVVHDLETATTPKRLRKKSKKTLKETEQEVIPNSPKPDKQRTRTTTTEETVVHDIDKTTTPKRLRKRSKKAEEAEEYNKTILTPKRQRNVSTQDQEALENEKETCPQIPLTSPKRKTKISTQDQETLENEKETCPQIALTSPKRKTKMSTQDQETLENKKETCPQIALTSPKRKTKMSTQDQETLENKKETCSQIPSTSTNRKKKMNNKNEKQKGLNLDCIGDWRQATEEVKKIGKADDENNYYVENILDCRFSQENGERDYFVKWLGWPDNFNEWVLEKDMDYSEDGLLPIWDHSRKEEIHTKNPMDFVNLSLKQQPKYIGQYW